MIRSKRKAESNHSPTTDAHKGVFEFEDDEDGMQSQSNASSYQPPPKMIKTDNQHRTHGAITIEADEVKESPTFAIAQSSASFPSTSSSSSLQSTSSSDSSFHRMKQLSRSQQSYRNEPSDPSTGSSTPLTFLIHSSNYSHLLDSQRIHLNRMHYFTALINSFRAYQWPNLTIHPPRFASEDELKMFHSPGYINFIRTIVDKYRRRTDTADTEANEYGIVENTIPLTPEECELQSQYGLMEDCPIIPELWNLIRSTVGGTLKAVELLESARIRHPHAPLTAIHWGGGRHHAESEVAKGFCFANDIVIAIIKLLSESRDFTRILYLDIDLHHGDGVEDAFAESDSVMTVSFHHCGPAFFPGSGEMDTKSKNVINIPLHAGIDDSTYCSIFDASLSLILPIFQPSHVIVCCGVDGLATDRMSPFNLTTRTYSTCVNIIKKRLGHIQPSQSTATRQASLNNSACSSSSGWLPPSPIPLLLLGGGGYNPLDSARSFMLMTASACGIRLPAKIRDTDAYYPEYAPTNFNLHSNPLPAETRPNENTPLYMKELIRHVKTKLSQWKAQQTSDEEEVEISQSAI